MLNLKSDSNFDNKIFKISSLAIIIIRGDIIININPQSITLENDGNEKEISSPSVPFINRPFESLFGIFILV